MGIAIAICATGATFGVVMTIFSFCNTLAELPNTLSPMFAYKKYPKCCDNSSVHMNRKVAYVLSVLTFIVCAYLCVQMAATLSGGAVAGILAVFVVGYVYFFFRVKYLKGQGRGSDRRDEGSLPAVGGQGKVLQLRGTPWLIL